MVCIDRLVRKADGTFRTRVAESVEQALGLAEGNVVISVEGSGMAESSPRLKGAEQESAPFSRGEEEASVLLLSAHYACTHCGISYEPPSPQLFSFNSPQGMCPDCTGLGIRFDFVIERLVPDDSLTIAKGAIAILGKLSSIGKWRKHILKGVGPSHRD